MAGVFFVLNSLLKENSAKEHIRFFKKREIALILLLTTWKLNVAIASKKNLIIKIVSRENYQRPMDSTTI